MNLLSDVNGKTGQRERGERERQRDHLLVYSHFSLESWHHWNKNRGKGVTSKGQDNSSKQQINELGFQMDNDMPSVVQFMPDRKKMYFSIFNYFSLEPNLMY